MLIAINGEAGSGKDTVADEICRQTGAIKIGLADVMKRFLLELMPDWKDRLFGPSQERNRPDALRNNMTARDMLQRLGTEFGRTPYEDIWVDYLLQKVRWLTESGYAYNPDFGAFVTHPKKLSNGFVVSDVRYDNEAKKLGDNGFVIIRVVRPGSGLPGKFGQHSSEAGISQDVVDVTFVNDFPLEELPAAVKNLLRAASVFAEDKREGSS